MKKLVPLAILLTVVIIGALAVLPVFGAGNGQQGLERAIKAQEKHTDALLAKEGVVGTAVGLNPSGKIAVLVLTAKPGVGGIPNKLEGVPVAVRMTGEFTALAGPPAPVASFTFSCNALDCDFDGSGSTGRKLGFEWDFENDGTFDAFTGSQVSNSYAIGGEYTVLLRVTDGKDDRADEVCQWLLATAGTPVRLPRRPRPKLFRVEGK